MAAPKIIRTLAGIRRSKPARPAEPLDPATIAAAIEQLQGTVNELIVNFNAHTHDENAAGSYTQNAVTSVPKAAFQVDGAGETAANLFVA